MRVRINNQPADLVELMSFVAARTAGDPGPWVCPCGRKHRGKDLSCWDVGGCGVRRADIGTDLHPLANTTNHSLGGHAS